MSFFAPMSRFGSGAGAAAAALELKTMVRELHRNGIEVYLDVVYNHTCEGDDTEPYTTSLRAIDNQEYYMLERSTGKAHFFNYSGCGNTLNANNGAAMRLVLDSLRHWRAAAACPRPGRRASPRWSGCRRRCVNPGTERLPRLSSCRVKEYHIDGFRFDLVRPRPGRSRCDAMTSSRASRAEPWLPLPPPAQASALCRAPDGSPMAAPPLIREMTHDPVLGRCKLIAEPWDCGGLYQARPQGSRRALRAFLQRPATGPLIGPP